MRKVVLLLVAVMVAACSRAPQPPADEKPVQAPVQPPIQDPVQAPATHEATLFPAEDRQVAYMIRDQGAPEETAVQEHLLRDGDRVAAVAGGKVYAVWYLRPDGVWRADPKNKGALLRYLPPEPKDGLIWHQKSGEAEVWFRLAETKECAQLVPTCWELTVLGRGERTVFRFVQGLGPIYAAADNWADPSLSFEKYLAPEGRPAPLPAGERQRLLGEVTAPPQAAPVVDGTAEQFETAVYEQAAVAGREVLRLDLNGDGKLDLVRGRFGVWSTAPLEFYEADGTRVGRSAVYKGEQRVEKLQFKGMRLPGFLVQTRSERDGNGVTIVTASANTYMKTWEMAPVYGWGMKTQGAPADRVKWTEDGTITVEWDLKDPARHTKVTVYKWYEDQAQTWSGVKQHSAAYRPEGKELAYPSTPKDLLQAAFVARWLGLNEELPRYFATPQAAAAFGADKRVSAPDYGPGEVRIGQVTPPTAPHTCGPEVREADPQGPGPHAFAAYWGGYEWCEAVWGTVTFGQDAQGRPVIVELKLEGEAGSAH